MKNCEIKCLLKKRIKRETEHLKIFHGEKMGVECAIVAAKSSGKAVERNRLKRRIRSIHRQKKTFETLYILKRGVEIPGYQELLSEIREKK